MSKVYHAPSFATYFARYVEWLIDTIFPPRATEVLVRHATLEALRAYYHPKSVRIETIEVIALLPYREPLIQALITEAKYENNGRAQSLLGQLLADYIKVCVTPRLHNSERLICVPLPLGTTRRRERGYNQVEEVARRAQQFVFFVVSSEVLVRVRETAPQTSLGREERKKNMDAAFSAARLLNPCAVYLLLDDVVTTGATLLAAQMALTKADATRIIILALAH